MAAPGSSSTTSRIWRTAIARADELDPHACRARVAAHFDLPVMGAGYERVYRRVLERHRQSRDTDEAGVMPRRAGGTLRSIHRDSSPLAEAALSS